MSIKLKWFPRSWIQLTFNDKTIYIDPSYLKSYFTHYPKRIESSSPEADDGLPEALPKGDLILFTHAHKDHCKASTLNQLRVDSTLILAPKSCRSELGSSFQIIKPGETFIYEGIQIETVPAYNRPEGSSIRKVHKRGDGIGYILTIDGIRIYHAGDTDLIPEMGSLGPIDTALLPIGGTFTMNIHEAVQAVKRISPRMFIPIHHLDEDPHLLKLELPEVDVRVLAMGEELLYQT